MVRWVKPRDSVGETPIARWVKPRGSGGWNPDSLRHLSTGHEHSRVVGYALPM